MGIGKEKKFIIVVNVMLVFVKRIILKQDTLLNGIKQDIGKKLNVNCVVSKLETQFGFFGHGFYHFVRVFSKYLKLG